MIEHITKVDIVTNTFEVGMKLTCDWYADREAVMSACQSKANTINVGALEFMPNIIPLTAIEINSSNSHHKQRTLMYHLTDFQ